MTNNENGATKLDAMMETLEGEIGIPQVCVAQLLLSYEKLSGAKFQNENAPTEEEFAAFRSYIINNYKKMRVEMGYGILMAEENGVDFGFSGGSFADGFGQTVYKKIDEWAIANGAQKQGGCYVATAVYGSYDCPQVWTLRRYRDTHLNRTMLGRAFIRTYYAVSPAMIRIVGSFWLNAIAKPRLDKLVERLKDQGVSSEPYKD